jgi:hypothetical protein
MEMRDEEFFAQAKAALYLDCKKVGLYCPQDFFFTQAMDAVIEKVQAGENPETEAVRLVGQYRRANNDIAREYNDGGSDPMPLLKAESDFTDIVKTWVLDITALKASRDASSHDVAGDVENTQWTGSFSPPPKEWASVVQPPQNSFEALYTDLQAKLLGYDKELILPSLNVQKPKAGVFDIVNVLLAVNGYVQGGAAVMDDELKESAVASLKHDLKNAVEAYYYANVNIIQNRETSDAFQGAITTISDQVVDSAIARAKATEKGVRFTG